MMNRDVLLEIASMLRPKQRTVFYAAIVEMFPSMTQFKDILRDVYMLICKNGGSVDTLRILPIETLPTRTRNAGFRMACKQSWLHIVEHLSTRLKIRDTSAYKYAALMCEFNDRCGPTTIYLMNKFPFTIDAVEMFLGRVCTTHYHWTKFYDGVLLIVNDMLVRYPSLENVYREKIRISRVKSFRYHRSTLPKIFKERPQLLIDTNCLWGKDLSDAITTLEIPASVVREKMPIWKRITPIVFGLLRCAEKLGYSPDLFSVEAAVRAHARGLTAKLSFIHLAPVKMFRLMQDLGVPNAEARVKAAIQRYNAKIGAMHVESIESLDWLLNDVGFSPVKNGVFRIVSSNYAVYEEILRRGITDFKSVKDDLSRRGESFGHIYGLEKHLEKAGWKLS